MVFREFVTEVDTGDVALSCLVATAVHSDGPAASGSRPVVIALHGFPDHRGSFRPLFAPLVNAGMDVVAPALRGYSPSGKARSGRHDALAAGEDAVALANHFSMGRPVRLVGHDWGAIAAFAAVSKAPERFSHLVTMAVPHPAAMLRAFRRPAQLKRSWYMGMFQLPKVAEYQLSKDNFALVDRLWKNWSPGYEAPAGEISAVKGGISERVGEVLQYYRALRDPARLRQARPTFGKVRVPSIHIHGENDGCIGAECCAGAERFYQSGFTLHTLQGAGHFFIHEKPDQVARILVDFLR
ncbi:MAG: alpha/beta hydrolase [Polyangiaceae bacterium]|nr:alpha/beta hydrolase [Polyangiaceae bacterium]